MIRQIQNKKIQNNTSESIKKSQNTTSQKLLLAKNYIEQELETQGYRGHVKYDRTSQTLIQYRVKEGIVAVLQKGKLCIFEMPMKKFKGVYPLEVQSVVSLANTDRTFIEFKGAYPLEVQSVDMDSIQTQKATCCSRCHTWRQQADITRCSCGGYLVPRKRFSVDTVKSWDEQFLEIEFARKDIRAAIRTERVLSRRTRQYTPTGITANLAGMSSTEMVDSHKEELLLIPSGDEVKTVQVKPILSCSLIFVAAISREDKPVTDTDKLEILKKYNLEPVNDDAKDRQFKSEAKQFINHTTPILSEQLMDSWNHSASRRQSKVYRRKVNSLEKKWDGTELRRLDYKYGHLSTKKDRKEKNQHITQSFASSIPIPTANQKA